MNAAFADRGRLLFATTPDSVFVWDTSKSQKRAASFNVNVERRGFAVSPDGKVVAIALQESGVALHDARTGASIVKPPTTNEPINSMFFSADGKTFAATTTEGRLLCWDLATGQQRRPTPDSRKGVAQRYFASAIEVDQTLLIWDCITGRIVRRVDDCPQPSALSPDGRYLASATALGIVLRETLSGKNIHQTFANLPGPPSVLRFSPDGSVLAASYSDGTILLWDARPTMTRINSEKFDGLWKALGDDDPTIAFAAMGALLASPKEAIALLKDKVKPAAPIAPEIVAQLLVDLNHPKYLVREKATKRLEVIANQIEESLELALIRANPEVERRIERALQAIRQPIASKEQLQSFRVIAVLEWIGTPDARELLGRLAQDEGPLAQRDRLGRGAIGRKLARDARDCLARLIVR